MPDGWSNGRIILTSVIISTLLRSHLRGFQHNRYDCEICKNTGRSALLFYGAGHYTTIEIFLRLIIFKIYLMILELKCVAYQDTSPYVICENKENINICLSALINLRCFWSSFKCWLPYDLLNYLGNHYWKSTRTCLSNYCSAIQFNASLRKLQLNQGL